MQIIQEVIQEKPYDSKIFTDYFGNLKIAVTDIETTGLYFQKNKIILGGTLHFAGNEKKVIQFFADSRVEEAEILAQYTEDLLKADVIVTYNGNKFDLPFIKYRMKLHEMSTDAFEEKYSLDMFQIIRKHSSLPEILPNLKQKTVEKYLGDHLERRDEISGADSVVLYNNYCAADSASKKDLQEKILLHNRDDVVRLSNMLRLFQQMDLHEIMQQSGFPIACKESIINLEKIKWSGKKLVAEGRISGTPMDYSCYDNGYELMVKKQEKRAKLTILCEEEAGHTFVDIKRMGMDVPALQKLPGYESGFLILKNDSAEKIQAKEVNMMIKTMFSKLLG